MTYFIQIRSDVCDFFFKIWNAILRQLWLQKNSELSMYKNCELFSLVCYKSDITQNTLFFRRNFSKFNFLAITEEREIYLIITNSIQCMESYKFPSTYTIISGLLDDVNNSKQQHFELCHSCSKQAFCIFWLVLIFGTILIYHQICMKFDTFILWKIANKFENTDQFYSFNS